MDNALSVKRNQIWKRNSVLVLEVGFAQLVNNYQRATDMAILWTLQWSASMHILDETNWIPVPYIYVYLGAVTSLALILG